MPKITFTIDTDSLEGSVTTHSGDCAYPDPVVLPLSWEYGAGSMMIEPVAQPEHPTQLREEYLQRELDAANHKLREYADKAQPERDAMAQPEPEGGYGMGTPEGAITLQGSEAPTVHKARLVVYGDTRSGAKAELDALEDQADRIVAKLERAALIRFLGPSPIDLTWGAA